MKVFDMVVVTGTNLEII